MESNKISVIVPVFNAEKYLDDTLGDLISQTYKELEIIIVNDGSRDKSAEIIDKYKKLDNRIKAITLKNSGPSKARNAGLKHATGEYIRFIDADDRIPFDSMEKIVEPFIQNKKIDFVIANYLSKPDKGYFTGSKLKNMLINKKELAELFLGYMKTFYVGVPWNKLYKRSIINKYNISFKEDVIWCEDFLFNIEYIKKIEQAYLLNVKNGVYQYCIREEGITCNLKNQEWDMLHNIDGIRYQVAKDFWCQFVEENIFEIQWNNAELYKKILNITKYYSNRLDVRYEQFKKYLMGKDVYKYIMLKCKQSNSFDWKLLKKAVRKNKYFGAFVYFSVKGFCARYLPWIEKIIRDEKATCE